MKIKLLMTIPEVVEYAFATGEYVGDGSITYNHILAAQQRYIVPILGQRLFDAIIEGSYEELREEYIAPTLGLLSRIEANLESYPPTTTERQRAKLYLSTLSEYLNANHAQFEEYRPEENVLNRCQIVGGYVL